jgi:predicted small metal-binding protein
MKQFSCGDVVPGCSATFSADTDDEILSAVHEHARRDHGMTEISDSMVAAVRENISTA